MKILLIDQAVTGHHVQYIQGLVCQEEQHEYLCVLPEQVQQMENCRQIITGQPRRTLKGYLAYLKTLKQTVATVNPDVIHLLYSDSFYRFFGLGLRRTFGKHRVVATLHSVPTAFVKLLGVKSVCRAVSHAVVHTQTLFTHLKKEGVRNVSVVEYPCFLPVKQVTAQQAKTALGILQDVPVIGALGGTRYDKGLDLLLMALEKVEKPFFLLVAGREQAIKQAQIDALTETYREKTKIILKNLTDEEYICCLQASDVIALPYRKMLTGASGPLVEGVACGKVIMGTDFGSIGQLIREKHIGYLWDTNLVENMTAVLNEALGKPLMEYDAEAKAFQESLSVTHFAEKYMQIYKQI